MRSRREFLAALLATPAALAATDGPRRPSALVSAAPLPDRLPVPEAVRRDFEYWPEKTPDAAARQLNDCLNEARPEKLSPEQVLWLLAEGRRIGCHAAMNYLARETGYADPQPVEPEDERARLQREYIDAVKDLQALTGRMERVGLIRSVA